MPEHCIVNWTYLCLNLLDLVVARRQHDTIGTAVAYMNLGVLVRVLLRDAAVRGVLEPLAAKAALATGRAGVTKCAIVVE